MNKVDKRKLIIRRTTDLLAHSNLFNIHNNVSAYPYFVFIISVCSTSNSCNSMYVFISVNLSSIFLHFLFIFIH